MDDNTQQTILIVLIVAVVLIATSIAVIVTGNPGHFGWLAVLLIFGLNLF